MDIILNEADFARNAIENCELGDSPFDTIGHVAKFYRYEGYGRADMTRLLEEFMLKCDPTINIVKWQDMIERQVKYAYKFPLVDIKYVPITQKELDICDGLSGRQMQRLMFTLICLAKYADLVNAKNNGWVNRQDKEIFKLANVMTSVKRQSLMLNDLRGAGLIRFSRKVDNVNINVTCIDNDGEPVLQIDDFRNLGNQYLRYRGEPYFTCASCGLVVKKTGNRQMYCADCGAEVHRQVMRDQWRTNNWPS